MPLIGRVAAKSRDYAIACQDVTSDDGNAAQFHLVLHPLRDPGRLRLRQMWIDSKTFATSKIVTAGNFTSAPYTRVPWEITFESTGGVAFISAETALAPLPNRQGAYDTATICFENVRFARNEPSRLSFYHATGGYDLREPE